MSPQGHSPEGTSVNRSFPSLKNRNIVRGASFVFISCLAIGYCLVPAPAFASKARVTIEPSRSNNIIYVKGANFPSQSTATVQTDVNGAKEERKVQVHDGGFKLAFARHSAEQRDLVKVKASARNKTASAHKTVQPSTDNSTNKDAFVTTTEAPTTTSTTAALSTPVTDAPAQPQGTTTPPTTAKSTTNTTAHAASAPTNSASGGAPAGYKLVWSDEFNGTSPDQSKWGLYEGAGNAGIGKRVTSAVSEGDGELKITGNGMNGGGLATNYNSTYGYYEVRSRFDANSTGYNTATLLWPVSEQWPQGGEIDLAEIFNGATDNAGSYVHWGSNNSQLYNEYNGDFSQWHTWAVDWQPDHLTYYLDGKAFWTVTNAAAIPHNPHFLGLQLDVNENQNKANGSAFHIDYVRVYQKG
jgi:beta-glucanase (GH16 family)